MVPADEIALLSPRLRTVADLAGRSECVADIGSDHARLPIALVRSERSPRAIVVEIAQGPWERALSAVSRAGLAERIDVRKGDGFEPVRPGECDVFVVAGMGARSIWSILTSPRAFQCLSYTSSRIVVQPMGSASLLRFLAQAAGMTVNADVRVRDGGILYECLALEARPGESLAAFHARGGATHLAEYDALPPSSRALLSVGEEPLSRRDPLAREALEARMAKLARAQSGAALSGDLRAVERAAAFAQERRAVEQLYRRYFGP